MRTALVAALLAAPAAAAGDRIEDVSAVLRQRSDDARTEDDVAFELAGLGRESVPVLFTLVTGEVYDAIDPELFSEPDAWRVPPDRFGAVGEAALVLLPASSVVRHVGVRVRAETELGVRLAGVRVLGLVGSAEGLPPLVEVLRALDGPQLGQRYVRAHFERAFEAILVDDREAWSALGELLAELEGMPLGVAVDAIAATGRSEGIDALLALLGRDADLDVSVVERVAALRSARPWDARYDPRRRLRKLLTAEAASLRAAAAVAAGRVNDADAAPDLVDLLDDREARVRRAAAWSLARMAGTAEPAEPEAWWAWYEAETKWHEEAFHGLVAELSGEDAALALEALRTLSRHRLFRDEVAVALADALPDQSSGVARASCAVLRELDAAAAVPGLVVALNADDAEVRWAVHETLAALTGEEFPCDRWIWTRFVDGELR